MKIERQTTIVEFRWFLLRTLVDCAYESREAHATSPDAAYRVWFREFHSRVDATMEAFSPQNVNYRALYTALMAIEAPISTVTHRVTEKIEEKRSRQVNPFPTTWEYLKWFADSFTPNYRLTQLSTVHVVDWRFTPGKTSNMAVSAIGEEQIRFLNRQSPEKRTRFFLALYRSGNSA